MHGATQCDPQISDRSRVADLPYGWGINFRDLRNLCPSNQGGRV